MSKTKLKTQDEFAAALHQTMLEISLLKELDKPLSMISDLNLYNFNEYSIISRTEINPSADRSSAVLSFPDDQAKETLLAVLQRSVKGKNDEQGAEAEQGAKVKRTPKRPAKSKSNTTISPPTNLSFLSISLEDPETKFAVSLSFKLRQHQEPGANQCTSLFSGLQTHSADHRLPYPRPPHLFHQVCVRHLQTPLKRI